MCKDTGSGAQPQVPLTASAQKSLSKKGPAGPSYPAQAGEQNLELF